MPIDVAIRLEREKRRAAREERSWERERLIYERVLTPSVIRLLMVVGIISYSTWCARSKENVGPVQSALAFALPGIGIPLIAAEAGIRDKWALAAISAAGIGYVTGEMLSGWQAAGVFPSGSSLLDQLSSLGKIEANIIGGLFQ